MNLLKIGDRYINLDRVTDFTVTPQAVLVYFDPHPMDRGTGAMETNWRFTGEEAEALTSWLDQNSDDAQVSFRRKLQSASSNKD